MSYVQKLTSDDLWPEHDRLLEEVEIVEEKQATLRRKIEAQKRKLSELGHRMHGLNSDKQSRMSKVRAIRNRIKKEYSPQLPKDWTPPVRKAVWPYWVDGKKYILFLEHQPTRKRCYFRASTRGEVTKGSPIGMMGALMVKVFPYTPDDGEFDADDLQPKCEAMLEERLMMEKAEWK